MARFSRLDVLNTLVTCGVVPLFYHADNDTAINIATALIKGGTKTIEFTNRGDNAIKVFDTLNPWLEENHPDIVLGVGSVIDAPTAALYIAHGANFIVSPVLNIEVALLCNRRKVAYIPGCGSASEVSQAEEYGVEICKIFPGTPVGGPGFVKAVRGPLPWARLMPTGGVDATEESISGWINAGACAVGMGSKLVVKELVKKGDFDAITERTKNAIKWAQEALNS